MFNSHLNRQGCALGGYELLTATSSPGPTAGGTNTHCTHTELLCPVHQFEIAGSHMP